MIQDFLFIATADGTLFPPTCNLFYCYIDMRLQTEEPVPESLNISWILMANKLRYQTIFLLFEVVCIVY